MISVSICLSVYLMACGNGGEQPRFHVCNNCTFILRHKMKTVTINHIV